MVLSIFPPNAAFEQCVIISSQLNCCFEAGKVWSNDFRENYWTHLSRCSWADRFSCLPFPVPVLGFSWCILSVSSEMFMRMILEPTCLFLNGKCSSETRNSTRVYPFFFFPPNQLFLCCSHWYIIGIRTVINCKSSLCLKFYYIFVDYVTCFLNGVAKILNTMTARDHIIFSRAYCQ